MFVELNQKQRIPLEIGQLYLLGKLGNGLENKSKHFIELEAEEEIDQKHCVIDVGYCEDVYVYDLFSLKGSLLNNKPLKALQKIRLQNGDILKVNKQEIKYYHEQSEVLHDSSGFLEINKNTTDIITSSPDSICQTENHLKRCNYNPSSNITQRCNNESYIYSLLSDEEEEKELAAVNWPDSENVADTEQAQVAKATEKEMDGSQFRICTQDYNEGFDKAMQSQIIPLIKHNTVLLNTTNNITQKFNNESLKNVHSLLADEEEDKELSAVKWSDSKNVENTTVSRSDCSTPDIFEFADIEKAQEAKETEKDKDKLVKETDTAEDVEDEEDLMLTQEFPLSSENKSLLQQGKPCLDKEYEEVLTLCDKENKSPKTLESLTDLPPTQLFDTNEVFDLEAEDKEDDLLTQVFTSPSKPSASNTTTTVPDKEATIVKKTSSIANTEKSPVKETTTPANTFKKTDKEVTSSVADTISDDLDLLMCTPQFIEEHDFLDKSEDLKQNILAAKNRNSFDKDTDDDNEDKKVEKENDDDDDLVKLLNVPKDTLDFEKLLPHLSKNSSSLSQVHKEKNANNFIQTFGKKQDEKRKSLSKTSIVNRDERLTARDKESKVAKCKELAKNKGNCSSTSSNRRKVRKPKEIEQNCNTSAKETDSEKQTSIREQRKRHAKDDTLGENLKLSKLEGNKQGQVSVTPSKASSTSSRNSLNSNRNASSTQALSENKNEPKYIIDLISDDEEDGLLTQEFAPSASNSTTISHESATNKCFNSTISNDKFMAKNPHHTTSIKETTTTITPANTFKKTDEKVTFVKKTSSVASTNSDDLDLLMCTPQFIEGFVFVEKSEDLKKNILAAKNRNFLHRDDNNEDKKDKQGNNEDDDLVMLLNVPKDTIDFEKLLPHLSKKSPSTSQFLGIEQKSLSKFSIVSHNAKRKEMTKNKGNISSTSSNNKKGRNPKEAVKKL